MIKISKFNVTGRIVVVGFAAWGSIAPLSGMAAESIAVQRQVSAAGLDLGSPDGASAFYARLKSAARALCASSDPVYRAPSWVSRECAQDAMAKAVRAAKRPLLAQLFVGDYGSKVAEKFGVVEVAHVARQ